MVRGKARSGMSVGQTLHATAQQQASPSSRPRQYVGRAKNLLLHVRWNIWDFVPRKQLLAARRALAPGPIERMEATLPLYFLWRIDR